jgi:hypothetical protein
MIEHIYFPPSATGQLSESDWVLYLEDYNRSNTSVKPVTPQSVASVAIESPISVQPNPIKIASHWNALHQHKWESAESSTQFARHWWDTIPQCDCNLEGLPKIDCESEDAYIDSKRVLHNAVNAKLASKYPNRDYPQVTQEQYRALWLNESPRKSSRLVITVATGHCKQLLKHTRQRFERYAEKHESDYVELTNEICESWHMEKLRVGVFASQYDQTLFFDADCVVTEKCRNLFEASKGVAIVDDWSALVRNERIDWIDQEYKAVMRSQDVEPQATWERCLNTGVVLCSRESNPWVPATKPFPPVHCAEQFWVDSHIKEFVALPEVCNWQWWRGKDFWRGIPDAEIIHFANCPRPERLELIQWAVEEF